MDEERLTELSRKLGTAMAENEAAYRFAEEYGDFKEEVCDALLDAKHKIDVFMDTLPKKQQAIYAQSMDDRRTTANHVFRQG